MLIIGGNAVERIREKQVQSKQEVRKTKIKSKIENTLNDIEEDFAERNKTTNQQRSDELIDFSVDEN